MSPASRRSVNRCERPPKASVGSSSRRPEFSQLGADRFALVGQRRFVDQTAVGEQGVSEGGEVVEQTGHVDGLAGELAGEQEVVGAELKAQTGEESGAGPGRLCGDRGEGVSDRRSDSRIVTVSHRPRAQPGQRERCVGERLVVGLPTGLVDRCQQP